MTYKTIKFEQEGPIGVLTLNRPERLNAINFDMRDELHSFFSEMSNDFNSSPFALRYSKGERGVFSSLLRISSAN